MRLTIKTSLFSINQIHIYIKNMLIRSVRKKYLRRIQTTDFCIQCIIFEKCRMVKQMGKSGNIDGDGATAPKIQALTSSVSSNMPTPASPPAPPVAVEMDLAAESCIHPNTESCIHPNQQAIDHQIVDVKNALNKLWELLHRSP